jgi:Dolichyl-phosphate-mannose-protein mannosyltransferase
MGVQPLADAAPLTWRGPRIRLSRFTGAVLVLALLTLLVDAIVLRVFPPALDRGKTSDLWPIVLNLANGQGMVGCAQKWFPVCGPANQVTGMFEPVPVLLFGAVAALAHDSLAIVAWVQVVVSILTVVGVALLTRQIAGPGTALFAGVIWMVYLPAVRLVPQIAEDLLAGLGLTWAMVAFLYARRTDRLLAWVAVGVCLGLGALSRSVVMVVAPTLAVGLLLQPPTAGRSRSWQFRRAVLLLVACGVVQLPWVVRNEIALGRPVLGSTLVGYNVFREAQALTTPNYLRYVTVDEARTAIDELLAGRPDLPPNANEAQLDAVYRQAGLNLIAEHPLRYLTLSGGRFLMLWFDWRVGGSDVDPKLNGAMGYLPDIQQVLLFVGSLVGLFVLPWRRSWPLVATIGAWCLAHMLVHAQERYIVPMMPLAVTAAAVGCTYLVERAWARAQLPADSPWGVLLQAVPRLKRETYAVIVAGTDARTPWYARAVALGGLVCGPLLIHNFTHGQPALDRFVDVVPILMGLVLARRLLPDWSLDASRRQAELALSRPGSGLLTAGIVVGWLMMAMLTLGLLALDPV